MGAAAPSGLQPFSGLATGSAFLAGAFHWKAPETPLTPARIFGKMKGRGWTLGRRAPSVQGSPRFPLPTLTR